MKSMRLLFLLAVILGAGALFGFYFTMSVSIMPGFDQTEPYSAIIANQEIGRATQKSFFFVALLGTPLALLVSLGLCRKTRGQRNWLLVSLLGWVAMIIVTLTLNVPLNEALDSQTITPDQSNLTEIWLAYSVDWQRWNWLRVAASGVSLIAAAMTLCYQKRRW